MASIATPQSRSTEELVRRVQRGECLRSRSMHFVIDRLVMAGLMGCALFSVGVTFAIIAVLAIETIRFFGLPDVSVREFLFGTQWTPNLGAVRHFGIWPLIFGTLMVTVVAMIVALPLGLVAAIFLSEYAPRRLRNLLKPILEILAGIPTVVYGFFALYVISPFLSDWLRIPGIEHLNALSAGIAVGILCIPVVCSLAEDALRAVPRGLREGALGLGGTKFDVAMKVVVPAALSGIISSFLLAIARAAGETMVVALAAGITARMSLDPRGSTQTMTGYMAQTAMGDVSNFGAEYLSLYAVAGTLFILTFSITVVGQIVRKRYRETYK